MFDLAGKTGLAAVTQETLLAVNPRLVEEIETLEGRISWGVGYDESWYRLEVPSKNLETALEILGRLLVTETFRPDAFKKAKEVQLEKIRKLEEGLTPAMRLIERFVNHCSASTRTPDRSKVRTQLSTPSFKAMSSTSIGASISPMTAS